MIPHMISRCYNTAHFLYYAKKNKKNHFLPKKEIEKIQSKHIKSIIHFAYTHVPFYRTVMKQRNLKPENIKTYNDLRKLPIITKEYYKNNMNKFIPKNLNTNTCLTLTTSGCTGKPLTVFYDFNSVLKTFAGNQIQREVLKECVNNNNNNNKINKKKNVYLRIPASSSDNMLSYFKKHMIIPRSRLSIDISTDNHVKNNLEQLKKLNPSIIRSYGSYLETIYRHIETHGCDYAGPDVILFSSDTLLPKVKQGLSKQWNCPILSNYAASENPLLGYECKEQYFIHSFIDF